MTRINSIIRISILNIMMKIEALTKFNDFEASENFLEEYARQNAQSQSQSLFIYFS